jgi:hypothetical protein
VEVLSHDHERDIWLFVLVRYDCYAPPRREKIGQDWELKQDDPMRLYIDLSCFNRPFDDQGQERIHLETEAVLLVLTRIVEGKDLLLWSWVMSFENDKHPRADRRDEIAVWEGRSERSVELSDALQVRARDMALMGIPALDAAHLAAAEVGGADIVLTCDDAMVRRAARLGLALRVLNPVAYLKEVTGNG